MKLTLSCMALLLLGAAGCENAGTGKKMEALEARIAKLEAEAGKMDDVAEFVRPIMAQQQAQQDAERRKAPAEDVRFAVSIEGNQFEGPAGAPVTIVEAFDFA